MQIGIVGMGRMGANMAKRLLRASHECVIFDQRTEAMDPVAAAGALVCHSLEELVAKLAAPRAVWLMLPAAVVASTLERLVTLLGPDDIVIDGGNSNYKSAVTHAARLKTIGIRFVDVGTSGGVWGLEQGYCLMIGGETEPVQFLDPIFRALAPGRDAAPPLHSGALDPIARTAEDGYLHCGPAGAGHFVKMVHNGIEYGMMAAYAEGFNLLAHANRGRTDRAADAETAPLDDPAAYQYEFDIASVAELWRRGSVVRSWLLDLAAEALHEDPQLEHMVGRVSDSGEGRWTLKAAIDLGVPMPALASALFERFTSQSESAFANRLLSAMRKQFGGHEEKH